MNKEPSIQLILKASEARLIRKACNAILVDGPEDVKEEDMLWYIVADISMKLRAETF